MNTPIIKISEDQNEIIHESGVVTVFKKTRKGSGCENCVYDYENTCLCYAANCDDYRLKRHGIFILKK